MFDYIIVAVLLVFSALFSGLTLGLMSLSAPELKRKMSLGSKAAEKVYAVRRRGNLLLTTLLIGNVAINSALAIFLGSIASGFMAGLISTALIVVFGEITPQAIFSRYALILGAKTAWIVKIFIFVLYPIAAPIAWLLNKALGEELATIYSKKELMKIVDEHKLAKDSDIDSEEAQIIAGALTFSSKKVHDIMTPRTVVYSLPATTKITDELRHEIAEEGFSRVPLYGTNTDDVVGVVHASQMMKKGTSEKALISIANTKVNVVHEDDLLDETLLNFIRSHNHLAVVKDEFGGVSGIVTLEDVLEEIIQAEIRDETDQATDMRKLAMKQA